MIDAHASKGVATGTPEADQLLRNDGNALLIGTLLDQQIRAEMAFEGPWKLRDRLGHLDMRKIAEMDEEAFKEVFSESPAVHRFTNMMADRVQALAKEVSTSYEGDGSQIWADGADKATVEKRGKELPGFGKSKVGVLLQALDLFGHRTFEEK